MGHELLTVDQVRSAGNHRWRLWLLVSGLVLVLVAALTIGYALTRPTDRDGLSALAGRDPNGAHACRILSDWLHNRTENQVVVSAAIGPIAAQASTERIRAAAGEPVDTSGVPTYKGGALQFANLAKLRQACWTEGVKLPEYY